MTITTLERVELPWQVTNLDEYDFSPRCDVGDCCFAAEFIVIIQACDCIRFWCSGCVTECTLLIANCPGMLMECGRCLTEVTAYEVSDFIKSVAPL